MKTTEQTVALDDVLQRVSKLPYWPDGNCVMAQDAYAVAACSALATDTFANAAYLCHAANELPICVEALKKVRTCSSLPDSVLELVKHALASAERVKV